MYFEEKQRRETAELAYKRILNKFFSQEKFSINEPVKPSKFYSKQVSPEGRDEYKYSKASRRAGLDLSKNYFSPKALSPVGLVFLFTLDIYPTQYARMKQ
jgi:hypothetical protein